MLLNCTFIISYFQERRNRRVILFIKFVQPLEKAANTCPGVLQYHVGRSAEGSTGVLT